MKIESGIYLIGKNSNLFKRFTVKFPDNRFHSVPVFVANTLQGKNYPQDIPDTFAVSVKSVTTAEAVVQVWRVDNPGPAKEWAQELRLGWIAFSNE